MDLTYEQKCGLHAVDGQKGDHYDLANWLECKGCVIRPDSDDLELSHIWLGDNLVGEIRGDAEATVNVNKEIK